MGIRTPDLEVAQLALSLPASVLLEDRRALHPVLGVEHREREGVLRLDSEELSAGLVHEEDFSVEARHPDEIAAVLHQGLVSGGLLLGPLALLELALKGVEEASVGDCERCPVSQRSGHFDAVVIERDRARPVPAQHHRTQGEAGDLEGKK